MRDEEHSLIPTGLMRRLLGSLSEAADQVSDQSPDDLLEKAEVYLEQVRLAHQRNPLVNVRLAEAIFQAIRAVIGDWPQVPPEARSWFLGAIQYFAGADDEEPDFASPIGFEDDAEVLNACLRLAGRDDLCLNTEDYDDV